MENWCVNPIELYNSNLTSLHVLVDELKAVHWPLSQHTFYIRFARTVQAPSPFIDTAHVL